MSKLIVLDYSEGKCHIYNMKTQDFAEAEEKVKELRYNEDEIAWMITNSSDYLTIYE